MNDYKDLIEHLRSADFYVPADAIEALQSRVSELEAARIAYASEFQPDADGLPDTGNIHANIRAMKAKVSALESRLAVTENAPDGIACREMTIKLLEKRIKELEEERAEREKQEPAAWLDKSTEERPGDTVWLPGDLKGMDTSWLVPLYAAPVVTSDMVNKSFADGKAEGHGDATEEASVVIGELRARVAELESDLFAWRDKYMFQAGQFDSLKEVATKLAEERAEREEQKPVAYMRKWKFDGEEPKKERNESGKMAWPFKFKLHPVTVNRCLNDDIRLYAAPPVTEHGQVTVTTDESGRAVAVTRQDDEHRILSVIWEAPATAPVRLTDRQIYEIMAEDDCFLGNVKEIARAVEDVVLRANGFKVDNQ